MPVKEMITWYTPEEKTPNPGRQILFKVCCNSSLHRGSFSDNKNIWYDEYESLIYNTDEVRRWSYMPTGEEAE